MKLKTHVRNQNTKKLPSETRMLKVMQKKDLMTNMMNSCMSENKIIFCINLKYAIEKIK